MVRTYKRTSTRDLKVLKPLEKAVDDVIKGKLSMKKPEILYDVPRKTIYICIYLSDFLSAQLSQWNVLPL